MKVLRHIKTMTFSFVWIFIANPVLATDITPFDISQAHNAYDISQLKCTGWNELVKNEYADEKTKISLFNVVVWANGLVRGMSGVRTPFTKEFLGGTAYLITNQCKIHNDSYVYDVIYNVTHGIK